MSARVLVWSDRLFRLVLQAYPASFRERFGTEMACVFQALCQSTYAASGAPGVVRLWLPTLWDGLRAAGLQWWRWFLRRRLPMTPASDIKPFAELDGLSAWQALWASLPFLAYGASSLAMRLPFFQSFPVTLPLWQIWLIHPNLIFYGLTLLGLGIGVLANFPRWTYSYLGWALYFVWWWKDMGYYGHASDWRISLPLIGVVLLTLGVRRSWRPLHNLIEGLRRDGTLLAFGIYILYAAVALLYDENHSPYLREFIAATTLAAGWAAWSFFRLGSPLRRILVLLSGIGAMTLLSTLNAQTWDYRAYYGLPESPGSANPFGVLFLVAVSVGLVVVGLVVGWRQRRHSA